MQPWKYDPSVNIFPHCIRITPYISSKVPSNSMADSCSTWPVTRKEAKIHLLPADTPSSKCGLYEWIYCYQILASDGTFYQMHVFAASRGDMGVVRGQVMLGLRPACLTLMNLVKRTILTLLSYWSPFISPTLSLSPLSFSKYLRLSWTYLGLPCVPPGIT